MSNKIYINDAVGNRTASQSVTSFDTVDNSYTSNKLNQVTTISASWSGGANTLASTLQYDQSGNLTKWTSTGTGEATPAHTEYVYDDLERLIAVIKKNPTTQTNLSKSEFVYDGGSRLRIAREYTWNDDAWVLVPNSEKRRIYDGMDVIQERDGNNAVIVTYIRDGNIGGILAKRDAQDDDYFFHYDGSGNVVGLTDEDQNSVAEYAYDAYGNLLSSSGAQASNNLYRYSTKEYFGHAGLYNYGLRFYSSGLGRWINRDPIAEAGGLNLYGFVGNSPINAMDMYGLLVLKRPLFINDPTTKAIIEDGYDPCDDWWDIINQLKSPEGQRILDAYDKASMLSIMMGVPAPKAPRPFSKVTLRKSQALLLGDDVVVGSIREADDVLKAALPNAKKVKGPGPHKALDPRPFKGKSPDGMYHKDYNVDPATGRIYGHGPDNPHGVSKHINVKLPTGKKVTINITLK